MLMENSFSFYLGGGLIVALIVIIFLAGRTPVAFGAAEPGTSATVATSSAQAVVAATAELLFATSTANSCLSRVVSTQGDAIKLTFSDYRGDVPSATIGHVQAASTTVAYDASTYGCNAVKVFSYGSQTLQIAEMR